MLACLSSRCSWCGHVCYSTQMSVNQVQAGSCQFMNSEPTINAFSQRPPGPPWSCTSWIHHALQAGKNSQHGNCRGSRRELGPVTGSGLGAGDLGESLRKQILLWIKCCYKRRAFLWDFFLLFWSVLRQNNEVALFCFTLTLSQGDLVWG